MEESEYMAKMRVHELAKELEIKSQEIIESLSGTEYEIKSASSNIDDAAQEIIRKKYKKSASKAEEKPAAEKAEKPAAPKAEEKARPEEKKPADAEHDRPKKKSSHTMSAYFSLLETKVSTRRNSSFIGKKPIVSSNWN